MSHKNSIKSLNALTEEKLETLKERRTVWKIMVPTYNSCTVAYFVIVEAHRVTSRAHEPGVVKLYQRH